MLLDFILYCALGVVTVALAVWGGHVSSSNVKHRIGFYVLGVISIILIFITGYRSYLAQLDAKEATVRLDKTISSLKDTSEAIANMSKETVRIGQLNTQLQEKLLGQSKTIADLSKQSINTAIGGNSFGYIDPVIINKDSWMAVFLPKGEYPLYEVKADIVDNIKFKQIPKDQWNNIETNLRNRFLINIGNVAAENKHQSVFIKKSIPIINDSKLSYNIFFSARNGLWTELLRIIKINEKYVGAIRVYMEDKIIFEEIDEGFPRNKQGEIEWDE